MLIEAFSTTRRRAVTTSLLVAFGLAAVATAVIGLDGRVLANLLALLSGTALVLAFAHPFRHPRQFKHLFYAGGLGFAVMVVLHNLLDAAGGVFGVLGVVAFLAALFVCSPAAVLGLIGTLVTSLRNRSRPGA